MAVPFDTLEYAQTLEKSGMTRSLAEDYSRALADLLGKFIRNKPASLDNHKQIFIDILEYIRQLTNANEKPAIALCHAEMLTEQLIKLK